MLYRSVAAGPFCTWCGSPPPVLQATKGKQSISFYTLPEYETWKEETGGHGWKIKYYKGGSQWGGVAWLQV